MISVVLAQDPSRNLDDLLQPTVLHRAGEVCGRPGPVPAAAGVYAWYFDRVPAGAPTDGCHMVDGAPLLYVGISPKAPPANGAASRQTIRSRIRYHYRGNAEGSTLRLTLGCLLTGELDLGLRRVGSGKRMTFGHDGEARLTAWMADHARVVWTVTDRPWELERQLIHSLVLPLNLDQNRRSQFRERLSLARSEQRAKARNLPIADASGESPVIGPVAASPSTSRHPDPEPLRDPQRLASLPAGTRFGSKRQLREG